MALLLIEPASSASADAVKLIHVYPATADDEDFNKKRHKFYDASRWSVYTIKNFRT